MSFGNKIKLAFYNLMRRKKTTAQCITMTTMIMLLIFVCAFFITTLSLQLTDSLDNYASTNYIELSSHSSDTVFSDTEITSLKKRFPTINQSVRHYRLGMVVSAPTNYPLTLDGEGFGESASTDYWADIIYKDRTQPLFAQNVYKEFQQKFSGQQIIKYGREIQNDGEILIPEQFLTAFNVTAEQVLNADKANYANILDDVKIVGIINENFAKIGDLDERLQFVYIFADKSALNPSFDFSNVTRLYLTNASEVSEIIDYVLKNYTDFFGYNYGNLAIRSRLELISKLLTFTQDIIAVLFGVIGIALIVFLYSVLSYNAKQKGSYFGMMRAMGMKNTLSISLIEMAITTLISAMLCLILSAITVFSLSGVVIAFSWFSKYTITVNGGIFALIFALTAATVAILNILLAFLSSKQHDKRTITTALRN